MHGQTQPSSEAATTGGPTTGLRIAFWAAIVLAVVLRVALLEAKPFWRDEAWVALLVGDPARAIAGKNAAPLGFLWLVHLTASLPWLSAHVAYRIVPLLVGIAVVPLMARLATASGASFRVGVIAAWIAAALPGFVYYSRELKSYDIDLLVAILAPLLAIRGFAGEQTSSRARTGLALLMLAVPWVSFGGLFPAAGVLAWLWLTTWRSASRAERIGVLACSIALAGSFAAAYFVAIAPQTQNPRLRAYWQPHFLSYGGAGLFRQVLLGVTQYLEITTRYLFTPVRAVAVALGIAGILCWPRRYRLSLVWMASATAAACVAAALLDRYLLAQGRLLLFAAPIFVLWVAAGLDAVAARIARRHAAVVAVSLCVLLSAHWSVESFARRIGRYDTDMTDFYRFDVRQDVEAAIDAAIAVAAPDEPVLFTRRAAYQYQFYAGDRLRSQATYCEVYCGDFPRRAKAWLDSVRESGLVVLIDEDMAMMRQIFREKGFVAVERARVDGVRLWQVAKAPDTRAVVPVL
jgi:hypothetical protein